MYHRNKLNCCLKFRSKIHGVPRPLNRHDVCLTQWPESLYGNNKNSQNSSHINSRVNGLNRNERMKHFLGGFVSYEGPWWAYLGICTAEEDLRGKNNSILFYGPENARSA